MLNKVYQNKKLLCEEETRCTVVPPKKRKLQQNKSYNTTKVTMDTSQVCRICLAHDKPMHAIENTALKEFYTKITGIPYDLKDGRDTVVCHICRHLLRGCHRFAESAIKADEALQRIFDIQAKMTDHLLSKIRKQFLFKALQNSPITKVKATNYDVTIEKQDEEYPLSMGGTDEERERTGPAIEISDIFSIPELPEIKEEPLTLDSGGTEEDRLSPEERMSSEDTQQSEDDQSTEADEDTPLERVRLERDKEQTVVIKQERDLEDSQIIPEDVFTREQVEIKNEPESVMTETEESMISTKDKLQYKDSIDGSRRLEKNYGTVKKGSILEKIRLAVEATESEEMYSPSEWDMDEEEEKYRLFSEDPLQYKDPNIFGPDDDVPLENFGPTEDATEDANTSTDIEVKEEPLVHNTESEDDRFPPVDTSQLQDHKYFLPDMTFRNEFANKSLKEAGQSSTVTSGLYAGFPDFTMANEDIESQRRPEQKVSQKLNSERSGELTSNLQLTEETCRPSRQYACYSRLSRTEAKASLRNKSAHEGCEEPDIDSLGLFGKRQTVRRVCSRAA
ncbi:hypothetical protein ABMA28_011266 [Loxostege sticticalis]|uniref:ZAD domain-containing protein n=1 Tax=Loxostege sticticalis TaxID=481309 RepID=A0ABD0S7W1_LOXSC